MKFEVELTDNAMNDFNALDKENKTRALKVFDIIENVDIQAVVTKPLTSKIYEIKANKLRCLFAYSNNKVIVVGVIFLKKTQKTPKSVLAKAEIELKEFIK